MRLRSGSWPSPGMTATVDFIVEKQTNVLLVPNSALRFRPTEKQLASLRGKMNEGGPMPGNGQIMPPKPDSLLASGRPDGKQPPPPDFSGEGMPPFGLPLGELLKGDMKKAYFLEKDGSLLWLLPGPKSRFVEPNGPIAL